MKNLLLSAALVLAFAAPAFAEDVQATATPAVTVETTVEGAATQAPSATPAQSDEPAAMASEEAKESCTSETNEKVKLPENAGDAEKAQWDAAFAECLKGKGVEPTAEVKVEVDATAPAAAATTEAEAKADADGEKK